MIVDSSVLVAILQQETEAVQFAAKLEEASICLISAISVLEARMVIESRFGDVGIRELEALVRKLRLEIVPFDADQIAFAHQAFRFLVRGGTRHGLILGTARFMRW